MPKLFSINDKKILKQVQKTETELNNFLTNHWKYFFSNFEFIKNEFQLSGNVRSDGSSGRIDIFAFNPKTRKFVIFELKKNFDRNISQQASDYKDFIEDNFAEIYLETTQKYGVNLPSYNEILKDQIEIIFIAQKFTQTHIVNAKKRNNVTLIKYFWFENDLFLVDYINNDPDDEERQNTEKIKKIKKIIDGKDELSEIAIFFYKKEKSKQFFDNFFNFLNGFGVVDLKINQTNISLKIKKSSFSIIPNNGGGKWKAFLQINTDFDITNIPSLVFDDRFGEKYLKEKGGKPKGSLGKERFEVFIQNEEQLEKLISFLKAKIF
ncbi:MAG: hypothetical protein Athens101410_497 [Parcubacteria group bacterium Athens1014_10]|nr:MAG: hypothetical protein Athens101410_497 [Parcubacteria group bacterium Athens1014_10]TSD04892.1 MAG: hypothetical protein Athens071412_573 [Parcubacteria group bacterium Athens0714_12]